MFGVSLLQLATRKGVLVNDAVPLPLYKCVRFLDIRLRTEGLFRLSASGGTCRCTRCLLSLELCLCLMNQTDISLQGTYASDVLPQVAWSRYVRHTTKAKTRISLPFLAQIHTPLQAS